MVISVLSSQDIEFFKDNPSPVYSFVDDVTKMVDIAPPKAKKRPCNEVQEGVKVKFPNNCVLADYFTVSNRLSMCKSLEIHAPSMPVNPCILAPRSC